MWVLTLPLVLVFFWLVKPVSVPILLGAVFAILLAPLHFKLAAKLGRRARMSPFIITTLAVILLVGPVTGVLAYAVTAVKNVKSSGAGETAERALTAGITFVQKFGRPLRAFGFDMSKRNIEENVKARVDAGVEQLGEAAGNAAMSAPQMIVAVFLFVIALYFFLRDGRALIDWLEDMSPLAPHDMKHLRESVRAAVHGVMLGELLTATAQAILCGVFLFALKVPGAFLWTVFSFVLAFVPLFGTAPVTLGATVYLFASGRTWAALIMAAGVIVIGGVDNVTRPFVAANQGRMHPLLVLASMFGGLAAIGAAGVFLGPVIAALAIWSIELYAARRDNVTAT